MNIFINWDYEKEQLLLPINPESFEKAGTQNNTSVYVHNLGEINLKGKRGLYEINIESFFPAQEYSFIQGNEFLEPYKYCAKLEKLYEDNTTVHLVITETDINMYCTIENFAYGETAGSRDVKYSLAFKEQREIIHKKRVIDKNTTSAKKTITYKWKKGDTWPKVCKKKLGSSKDWKKIRKKNLSVITKAKKKHKGKKETVALIGSKVVLKK